MMKDINNTEEQLYNQFMAELEDGEKEYDRMMAEGKAPALKASKPKTTIISIVHWAAIAACFIGVIMGGYLYFLNNTDEQHLAIADNSRQKENESYATKSEKVDVEKNIAELHIEKKDVKRFNIKKDIEIKKERDFECFLPEIILNVPNTDVEDGSTAQYPKIRKEYDFDVVCYNVLPEISDSDNKAIASANLETKQICDNIYYYNEVKSLKHSQQ